MCSLSKYQQCFLVNLLPLPPPIPNATQIQYNKGDSRLAPRLAIAKYNMAESKHKISVFHRHTSLSAPL